MRTLRELSRRKLRTTLTILGIAIGIGALVVFSSLANKINGLVASGSDYYTGKVVITDASGDRFGVNATPVQLSLVADAAKVPGVAAAQAVVQILVDQQPATGFAPPEQIVGAVAGSDLGNDTLDVHYAQGRALTAADEGTNVVVLGADMARRHHLVPGDAITLRGESFTVVGTLEPTLSFPDNQARLPLAAAQRLYARDLPPLVARAVDPSQVVSQIVVYATPGTDVDALAARLEAALPSVTTLTAGKFNQDVGSQTGIFNAIIVGVAVISLIVGGLSVINTMAMTVTERTREIGIKRAIGATRRRIVVELVGEAGLIGAIGGLIGLGLGALVVFVANEAGRSSGTSIFDLTQGTALYAIAFSTILGMLAGIVPAWNAARMDPVAALRYQ